MQMFTHLTANNQQLQPHPFGREIIMQAYLMEHPAIFEFDGDFGDPEVIAEEITLKGAAKRPGRDGRLDLLVRFSEGYLGVAELKTVPLTKETVKQLDAYIRERKQILDHPMFEAENLDELSKDGNWVGILVGPSIDPELASEIRSGKLTLDAGIPLIALTIQRFKSQAGSGVETVFVATETTRAPVRTKDHSKYRFMSQVYGKSPLVRAVVHHHAKSLQDQSFEKLREAFPDKLQGSLGVVSRLETATELANRWGHKRHALRPGDLVKFDDELIAICNQWGVGNIDKFIDHATKGLGHSIEKI